jgi:uncharacterized protein (TIGR03435 family)
MGVRRFAIWFWLGAAAFGQQSKFEVATVKPAAPNDSASGVMPGASPGRIEFRNMTLRLLIYQAYGSGLSTAMSVSGGPDWMNRNRYTIEAVAQGDPTDHDYRAMLRSLLEERFGLKTRGDARDRCLRARAGSRGQKTRAEGKALGRNVRQRERAAPRR